MKKLGFILLCVLLVLPIVSASRDAMMSDKVTVRTTISSTVDIVPKKSSFTLQDVDIKLFLVPVGDERSKLVSLEMSSNAEKLENHILFSYERPKEDIEFKVEAVIEANGEFIPVHKKIVYPLVNVPASVDKYLEPGEIINSEHPAVVLKANQLAHGEDDAYVIAYKIGAWIQDNIDYSLDSLTSDVSQPVSWVIENKRGVCDEITSLFIAMLRAVGIPARFISGLAYTDYNNLNDFGPHAWADVYFPTVGWVPFDITYGEYGYVDAPHIKLKEDVDADDVSTKFSWKGVNVDLEPQELKIEGEIIETGRRVKKLLDIETRALKSGVGFGSYNLIEAKVKNPNSFYVITDLTLTKTQGVESLDKHRKNILVKPREEKKFYWTVKIKEGLEEGFVYTYPVGVYTTRNASSTVSFNAQKKFDAYSKEEIKGFIDYFDSGIEEGEERVPEQNLENPSEIGGFARFLAWLNGLFG